MRCRYAIQIFGVCLVLVGPTMSQTTFLDDNNMIRQTFRFIRGQVLGFTGHSGRSMEAYKINKKSGRMQPEFGTDVPFFCDENGPGARSKTPPESVHELRLGDIDIVGAIGDSLTAGNGGAAVNMFQVLTENRGMTALIGGEKTWRQYFTLPNALKVFNPKLYGYSKGDGLSITSQVSKFNVADSGAMSRDTPNMAKILVQRIKNDPNVDIENHWKMISMLIGGNDFCYDICYVDINKIVDNMEVDLLSVLRTLRDNLPRTFFNLILGPSMDGLLDLRGKPMECVTLHRFECPCLFGKQFKPKRKKLLQIVRDWQQRQFEVVAREEFQNRTDFAVVIQPFTESGLYFPTLENGSTDLSYLSMDCFHFSQKGFSLKANGLWNNLLEPVGNKSRGWKVNFVDVKCPTEEMPYLYTDKNSQKSFT